MTEVKKKEKNIIERRVECGALRICAETARSRRWIKESIEGGLSR